MRSYRILLLAAALLGNSVQADWLLSGYPTLACDSAATRQTYGVQTFANSASHIAATVRTPGSLQVDAIFASDGTEGYSANLGLMHPYRPDWSTADISVLTAVTFDIKTSVKPTDGWEFSFGSKEYGDLAQAGTVLLTAFAVPAAGVWTTVTITPDMLAYPSWFCDDVAKPCPPITLQQVLKATEYIRIAPKTKYSQSGTSNGMACQSCVGPTTAAVTFEIRNIAVNGFEIGHGTNPSGVGCADATSLLTLDGFDSQDNMNEAGGYWYAFTDTNTANPDDSAVGKSVATLIDDGSLGEGMAMTAALDKNVPGSTIGTYHKYAGWATLGTNFQDGRSVDLTGATAIGFKVVKDSAFSDKIALNFKVGNKYIKADRPYMVTIPATQMDGSEVCVRISGENIDVKQASWVTPKEPLRLDAIKDLSWELRIADQSDPRIATAKGTILVTDVKIYGLGAHPTVGGWYTGTTLPASPAPRIAPLARTAAPTSCADGIRPYARPALPALDARYEGGLLTLRDAEAYRSLEIVGVDGSRIASFRLDAAALHDGLRVDLQPGAYVLVARDGAGRSLSKALPVVR